jgi:hypothetical protein
MPLTDWELISEPVVDGWLGDAQQVNRDGRMRDGDDRPWWWPDLIPLEFDSEWQEFYDGCLVMWGEAYEADREQRDRRELVRIELAMKPGEQEFGEAVIEALRPEAA